MKTTLIVADFRYDDILPCLARYSAASSALFICGKKKDIKEIITEISQNYDFQSANKDRGFQPHWDALKQMQNADVIKSAAKKHEYAELIQNILTSLSPMNNQQKGTFNSEW